MRIFPYAIIIAVVALLGCAAVSWSGSPRPAPWWERPPQRRSPAPLSRPVAAPIASQAPLVALEPPEIETIAVVALEPEPEAPFSEPWWLAIRVESTGYCPCRRCCGSSADGTVAWHPNGRKRHCRDHPWGIAADPAILPYGTRVAVPREPGTREYKPSAYYPDEWAWTVDDTGGDMRAAYSGALRRGREPHIAIDLRFIHHRSGVDYGRHHRTVFVDTRTLTPRQIARLEQFRDPNYARPYTPPLIVRR